MRLFGKRAPAWGVPQERALTHESWPVALMGSSGVPGAFRATPESGARMPVVMSAIRILAETLGMLELAMYERRDGRWELDPDGAEVDLLENPTGLVSSFALKAFAVSSLNGWGNGYFHKLRTFTRGEVSELIPVHPGIVRPRLHNGELVYDILDGSNATVGKSDLLHIPGVLWGSPYVGVSPITQHAESLGIQLAVQAYQGNFLRNDATPPLFIKGNILAQKDQRDTFREAWRARQGGANAGTPALGWGDMELQPIGISPKDAEYLGLLRWGVQDTARAFRVPSGMLEDTQSVSDAADPVQEDLRLSKHSVGPWARRFSDAYRADSDLVPASLTRRPGFLFDALTALDPKARAEADHKLRQAGLATANELRSHYGLPRHPDGDVLLVTPVGAGPNEVKP